MAWALEVNPDALIYVQSEMRCLEVVELLQRMKILYIFFLQLLAGPGFLLLELRLHKNEQIASLVKHPNAFFESAIAF